MIQFPIQTCTKQITSHKSPTTSLKQATKLGTLKMTTSKTSTYQESSKLKMQTGKQGKQSTSVPHVSQPNSTQATIALVVSNCKHAKFKNQQTQTCKTSKSSSSNYCLSPTHLPTCQQLKRLHSHFSWVASPYYSNCKHNFQVLSVSWPRSSFPFGRISVLERKRLRASISSP